MVWEPAVRRLSCDQHPIAVVNHMRAPDQVRAITILSYRNQALCYSRTIAYRAGSDMLFSSGDSPQSASSNLSGEGFDEVQPGESPFFISAAGPLAARLVLWRNGIKHHGLMLRHTCSRGPATTRPSSRHQIRARPPRSQQRTGTHRPQSGRPRLYVITTATNGAAPACSIEPPHSSSFFACPSTGPLEGDSNHEI